MARALILSGEEEEMSEGVQAMICDSTNVFLPGHGGSEAEVMEPLKALISSAKGAVAATTFASNVARLRSIAVAAAECGRAVVLVGRAMDRMVATGKAQPAARVACGGPGKRRGGTFTTPSGLGLCSRAVRSVVSVPSCRLVSSVSERS